MQRGNTRIVFFVHHGILCRMEHHDTVWHRFATRNNLSAIQLHQFQDYYRMLLAAQERFNITAITDIESVIAYHFEDSLKIGQFIDFSRIASIGDIGTGGGFPGIPLKIIYPHIAVTLVEVSQKKVHFLQEVIQQLSLENITTCDLDWRTFLRKTDTPIDLFCSRASLHPDELIRMFSASSAYKNSQLVYWASREWKPHKREVAYLKTCYSYQVGERTRNYCIFSLER